MDLKEFHLEFTPGSFWGFTISVGATIQVEPGDSIKILQRAYNGQSAYRLEENLWVTVGGTVYTMDNSSLIIDESNWVYSYNGITGAYRSANLDIDCANGDLNAPVFTIKGDIYLEKLSEKVAKAANGSYYYYDESAWQIAQESGGVISYGGQQKLVITAEGDVTYYTLVEEQLKLGSDGSVTWLTTPQTVAKNNTVDTGVSYLSGTWKAAATSASRCSIPKAASWTTTIPARRISALTARYTSLCIPAAASAFPTICWISTRAA
jgi:hypothetical protein